MELMQGSEARCGCVRRIRMRLLILILIAAASIFSTRTLLAMDGDLVWATQAGGSDHDFGNDNAVLSDGSTLVTGQFRATATFGAGEVNETTLVSADSLDIYVAKYNPDGTLAWAKRAGGTGSDEGNGIATLSDDSAIAVGRFQGTATFDGTTLTSTGSYDIFVAKYNADGTLAWAKSSGGPNFDEAYGIATMLPDGSAIVTGRFQDTATFDGTTLTSAGFRDIFVAKYNSDGTVAWARRAGGTGSDEGFAVGAAPDGSGVLVTGYIEGAATFDVGDGGTIGMASAGSHDLFVAKYSSGGILAWVTGAGGTGIDEGSGVSVLAGGTALVTGCFSDTATFDGATLISAGLLDVFVAEYNSDGTLAWVAQGGGTAADGAYSVATMSDGTALVTGYFSGTATFGGTTLTSAGSLDVFVAQYDPEGTLAWATQAGGVGDDEGFSVSTLPEGNAFVTGYFMGAATFDGATLTSAGGIDIFVAQFEASPSVAELEVEIDIRPGAYPNNVNLGSHGIVPVAILSSADFDATEVDPATVVLSGASVAIRGHGNKLLTNEEDVNDDSLLDLVVKVETENFDPDQFQDGYAYLTAETYDGVPVVGSDEITIVPPE